MRSTDRTRLRDGVHHLHHGGNASDDDGTLAGRDDTGGRPTVRRATGLFIDRVVTISMLVVGLRWCLVLNNQQSPRTSHWISREDRTTLVAENQTEK